MFRFSFDLLYSIGIVLGVLAILVSAYVTYFLLRELIKLSLKKPAFQSFAQKTEYMQVHIMIDLPFIKDGKLKWQMPKAYDISEFGFVPRVGDNIILENFLPPLDKEVYDLLDNAHSVKVSEVNIYLTSEKELGAVVWTDRSKLFSPKQA